MSTSLPSQLHLSLAMVATSAVAGPVTRAQYDLLLQSSLVLALEIVSVQTSLGNHASHQASAQYLMGPTCASNAGSAVLLAPSMVAQTKSMFLPPGLAEQAVAAVLRTEWSADQFIPMHSMA